MKKIAVEERVLEIVNRISGNKIKSINPKRELKSELSLDSIQIVELFVALENEFEIELPLQMMTVKTGKEFLDLLKVQLNKRVLCHV